MEGRAARQATGRCPAGAGYGTGSTNWCSCQCSGEGCQCTWRSKSSAARRPVASASRRGAMASAGAGAAVGRPLVATVDQPFQGPAGGSAARVAAVVTRTRAKSTSNKVNAPHIRYDVKVYVSVERERAERDRERLDLILRLSLHSMSGCARVSCVMNMRIRMGMRSRILHAQYFSQCSPFHALRAAAARGCRAHLEVS